MKIKLLTTWWPEVEEVIKKDTVLNKLIRPNDISFVFDANSEVFEYFIDITKYTRGCSLNPIMEFNAKEVQQAKLFLLQPRGSIVQETIIDEEMNSVEIESTPIVFTVAQTQICLPQQMYLSKFSIKPNTISAMDLNGIFILPDSIAEIFRNTGLTGFATKPIINSKSNEAYSNCALLFSDNLMPKAVNDITMFRAGSCFRKMGCLTYDKLSFDSVKDFNRTSENWDTYNFPDWVVSSRTKKCYDDHKLKGWYFEPILEKGTLLYETYIQKWQSLFRKVRCNKGNRIAGLNDNWPDLS